MIVVFSVIAAYTMFSLFHISANAIVQWAYDHEDLVAGIITATVLGIALIAARRTLGAMRHDRFTTIAMNLRRDYDSGIVVEGRKLAYKIDAELTSRGIEDKPSAFASTVEHYKVHYADEFAKLVSVPAMFDMIGWLVRNGCCKVTAIDEQINWERAYEQWETYIRRIQNKDKQEPLDDKSIAMYGNFVWLVNQLQKFKCTSGK